MDDVTPTRLPAPAPRSGPVAGPHTPGLGGYLVAGVVADLAFTVLLLGALAPDEVDRSPSVVLRDLTAGAAVLGFYVAAVSVLVAPPVLLVVHLLCRREPDQTLHVVAAGLVGAAAGWLVGLVFAGIAGLPLLLGASAAVGRWAVVPLVSRRRATR